MLQHPKVRFARPSLMSTRCLDDQVDLCGVCGAPSTDTVAFELAGQTFEKDLCPGHLAELLHCAALRPEDL